MGTERSGVFPTPVAVAAPLRRWVTEEAARTGQTVTHLGLQAQLGARVSSATWRHAMNGTRVHPEQALRISAFTGGAVSAHELMTAPTKPQKATAR